jgi:nucleoside-diphosphate-sugar epimerase
MVEQAPRALSTRDFLQGKPVRTSDDNRPELSASMADDAVRFILWVAEHGPSKPFVACREAGCVGSPVNVLYHATFMAPIYECDNGEVDLLPEFGLSR